MKNFSIFILIILIFLVVSFNIIVKNNDDLDTPNYDESSYNQSHSEESLLEYDSQLAASIEDFSGSTIENNLASANSFNLQNSLINNTNSFYYNSLTDIQKDIYMSLLNGYSNYSGKIKINNSNLNDFYLARFAINNDHPEFFWTNYCAITTSRYSKKVTEVSYTVPSDAKDKLITINNKIDEIISLGPTDTYSKLKNIYDWIVDNTQYGVTNNSQDITSVFFDGTSVCAGYSKAFQYMCQRAGIPCTYVAGFTKNNESHAWNLLYLNNHYYWVDVTWGDPVFAGMKDSITNYNYFLVSDKDFINNHVIDYYARYENEDPIELPFVFPLCSDDSLNYYVKKGCYFETYDKLAIEDYIASYLRKGIKKDIELKFSSKEAFEEFFKDYFDKDDAYIFKVIKRNMFNLQGISIDYSYIESANYLVLNVEG